MAGVAGCCAAYSWTGQNFAEISKNGGGNQVNFFWFNKGDPEIEKFKEHAKAFEDFGEIVLVTIDNETMNKFKNKKFFDRHDELQARDERNGRDDLRVGDIVISRANPYDYGYAHYRISEISKNNDVALEYYDRYYKKWSRYGGGYKLNQWLRTEYK